jgi:hypothetical protein
MARSVKNDNEFSDMEEFDRLRLVVQAALDIHESGAPLMVLNGRLKGAQGVMIWIPGYTIQDGEMNLITEAIKG